MSRCLCPHVEHTTALQRIQYLYHYQYQCVEKRKRAPCVYFYRHKALDLYSHTYTHKSTTTDCASETCSSDPLRECPITIAYHRHHPSSFPYMDCTGLVQGLIGVPLPTPHQVLDCQKTPSLPFIQLRVLGIGCVLIFFPQG